jgi:hypothetical protein
MQACPRSAHLQRGVVRGRGIPGSLATRFAAGWLLAFPSFVRARPFGNGSGEGKQAPHGSGGVVCCTRCVFGCGGLQALLRLYPLHAARLVGVSQVGTCALVVLFISCLMELRLGVW